MAEIYMKSKNVIIWLGEEADDSSCAMQMIQSIDRRWASRTSQSREGFRTAAQHLNDRVLQAISKLLKRPWWCRAWVIQEATCANETLVKCGRETTDFTAFVATVNCLGYHVLETSLQYHSAPDMLHLQRVFALDQLKLERARANYRPNMLDILDRFRTCKASDPRDKIFAFAVLATGTERETINPDYTIPVNMAYMKFVYAFIRCLNSGGHLQLSYEPNLAVLGVCFVQSYVFIASAYYLPLFFQGALGATPILSGVYLLPTAVSLSVASIGTGVYMRKTGKYLAPMYAGFVLQTVGYGLFISLGSEASWAKVILFQIVAGIGVGPNFQAPMVALQSFISPREVAAATSSFAFTRNLAGAVSIVIGQVVFQNKMSVRADALVAALGPELSGKLGGPAAGASTGLIRHLPDAQRRVVYDAFADSLKYLWIMYTAVSAVSLVIIPFMGTRQKLTEEHKETETGLEAEKAAREERLKEQSEKRRESVTLRLEPLLQIDNPYPLRLLV
ncbi:hypothetical protein MHUMG1_09306 [Metarhizium humberi]|uniref:Heterokaryon incompatibility domain-containing protein n=1 Tax=Metarhizium humberi TaxID=2596975 RepID=A0A9P8S491_9HYPO|nr:hypothetical protein MHUMG1_09306 [Metarhizium humberi]